MPGLLRSMNSLGRQSTVWYSAYIAKCLTDENVLNSVVQLRVLQALTLGFSDRVGLHSYQLFDFAKVKVKREMTPLNKS